MAVNSKKLTDFFKPQEKTLSSVSKQKNLLQFFAKSDVKEESSSVAEEEELLLSVNKENTVNGASVQSCGELNAEVISLLEDSTEDVSQSSKKKKRKKKKHLEGPEESATKDASGSSDIPDTVKHSNLETKRKKKGSEVDSCDIETNKPDGEIVKEGKTPAKKEDKKASKKDDKKSVKKEGKKTGKKGVNKPKDNLNVDHKYTEKLQNLTEQESGTVKVEVVKSDEKVDTSGSGTNREDHIESEFKHPKDVKSIKGGTCTRLRKTSGDTSVHKEQANVSENEQQDEDENLKPSQLTKKGTLCGKEMMSLLREIKDSEDSASGGKKKKHKSKKKHKDKDREKEEGEVLGGIDVKDTSSKPCIEITDPSQEDVEMNSLATVDDSKGLNQVDEMVELTTQKSDPTVKVRKAKDKKKGGKSVNTELKNSIHKKSKKSKMSHSEKPEHCSDIETTENPPEEVKSGKEISYDDFIRTLERNDVDAEKKDSQKTEEDVLETSEWKKERIEPGEDLAETEKDVKEEIIVDDDTVEKGSAVKEKQTTTPKSKVKQAKKLKSQTIGGAGGIAKFFMTSTPNRNKKAENSACGNTNIKDDAVEVNESLNEFATPKPVKRKRREGRTKVEVEVSDATSDETQDTDTDTSGERRRSQRKKYKVSVFQMDEDQRTPIKIKLRRCPASSSSLGEDPDGKKQTMKTKLKTTVSKASELLKKAKKSKHKKSHKSKDEPKIKRKKVKENQENSRHSARLKDRKMPSMEEVSLDAIVLLSDEEQEKTSAKSKKDRALVRKKEKHAKHADSGTEGPNCKTKKESGKEIKHQTKLSGTPKKKAVKKGAETVRKGEGTPKKTATPKKGSKMHPMFMMGKKGVENSPKKPVLSEAEQKQRQDFLMSGIPSELKKQSVTRTIAAGVLDYPPLPTDSHILQIGDVADTASGKMWNLPHVSLKIVADTQWSRLVSPRSRFSGDLVKRYEKPFDGSLLKTFSGHAAMDEKILELCIQEVECLNPSYPASKMFSKLKQLKQDWELFSQSKGVEPELKTSMKGILSECVEEKEKKASKKSRRSLKLSKDTPETNNDVVIIDAADQPEKPKAAVPTILWTDKYSPSSCSEVLGNSSVMKKLRTWLDEWKKLLDKERRKACKMLKKKNRGKASGPVAGSDSDDSDFDIDSEDSDDDDSVCNTMLLTGAHGCGKTSSVYALAQELGFKVHEVNASSSRHGKHLLCQLQEATQSHQVASTGSNTPSKMAARMRTPAKPEPPKLPSAFTNLFKKKEKESVGKEVANKEEKGKKRKRHKSDKGTSPEQKRLKIQPLAPALTDTDSNITASLNLSSTTLILFDEVDVIFKEDTGFLSAVQTFMATTKIPIILTTADPSFITRFDGRYEQVQLRKPSVVSLTGHLQTVALVEGIRTNPDLLSDMVQIYNQDIRRCLVTLQWLVQSGGSQARITRPLAGPAISSISSEPAAAQSLPQTNIVSETTESVDPDDDDFVALKPLRKRRRIIDDDSSNSIDPGLFKAAEKRLITQTGDEGVPADDCPLVHQLGLEPFLAGCTTEKETLSQQLLRCLAMQSSVSIEEMTHLCKVVNTCTKSPFIYNNVHILCPLRHVVSDLVIRPQSKHTCSKKRKRIKSDLYDSEESNNAVDSGVSGETESRLTPVNEEGDNSERQLTKESNKLVGQSLSAFTDFYDCLSDLDLFEGRLRMSSTNRLESDACTKVRGRLLPGLENELPCIQSVYELDEDVCSTYVSEVEVRTLCRLHSRLAHIQSEVGQEGKDEALTEQLVLPVPKEREHFTLADKVTHRLADGPQRVYSNVRSSLPDNLHCSHRSVHLDYLPCLRDVCRTEQARQLCNTKRRFHHYFDSIGLPLKDKSIGILATTFL